MLKYLWASPNTLIGLLLIPAAIGSGSGRQIVDGVLEIHSPAIDWILRCLIPIRGGAAAITLGHVVAGRNLTALLSSLPTCWPECGHGRADKARTKATISSAAHVSWRNPTAPDW